MDFFRKSKHVEIFGGHFVQARRYQVGFGAFTVGLLLAVISGGFGFNSYMNSGSKLVDVRSTSDVAPQLLKDYVIAGAMHDSEERYDPPKCHEDTRLSFLAGIRAAMEGPLSDSTSPLVTWIYGPAGVGKTAVAQTLAEEWEKRGNLAGSFFFWRASPGRNEKRYVITTIAYQLTKSFPDIRPSLEQVIVNDPVFFERSLSAQADMLITTLLETFYPLSKKVNMDNPKVIVLDGLDEIEGESTQRDVLQVFLSMVLKRSLPLRLLILSRPERPIREVLDTVNPTYLWRRSMSELNNHQDIETFLRSEFDSLKLRRPWFNRPDWPPPDAIPALVQHSSGIFIYSVVVLRHISNSTAIDKALENVLNIGALAGDTQNPYTRLDAMYHHILSSLSPPTLEFANILLSCWLDRHLGVFVKDAFLTSDPVLSAWELQNLHSVVQIDPVIGGITIPLRQGVDVQPIHSSLLDFVESPSRSGRFNLDVQLSHSYVTLGIFHSLFSRGNTVDASPIAILLKLLKYYLSDELAPLPPLRNCLVRIDFGGNAGFEFAGALAEAEEAGPQMRNSVISYLEKCEQERDPSFLSPMLKCMRCTIDNFLLSTLGIDRSAEHLRDIQERMLASIGNEPCGIGPPTSQLEA